MAYGVDHPARYALMFGEGAPVRSHPECQVAAGAAFRTLVEAIAACGVPDAEARAGISWAAQHGVVELARHDLRPCQPLVDDLVRMQEAWLDALPTS